MVRIIDYSTPCVLESGVFWFVGSRIYLVLWCLENFYEALIVKFVDVKFRI